MPMTRLPRIALIVIGILVVLIVLMVLSTSNPQPEIKTGPEIQGVQEVQEVQGVQIQEAQEIQEVQGVQEIPPATSSPMQAPTRSKDLMKTGDNGLQLKSAPASVVSHASTNIQLKDPVRGMEKELDNWMDNPVGSK